MQKSKRKLTLSTETIHNLNPEELGRVAGGWVKLDTYQNSCNGHSCDLSCNGACVIQPTKP